MAQQHLHSSKTLTLKAFQLWDTWSPELTSLERKATLKDPYPPPKSTQNMQSCDGQCFGNTRAHQSRISSHFYLSCQTETFEHCAPLHLQASFSSAPINGQFSVVPPSFTTLQMQSFQEEKKGGKKKNTSSESYKQVWKQARGEEWGRGKEEDGGKKEEEVRCYAPVRAVGFSLWLLHVAEAH